LIEEAGSALGSHSLDELIVFTDLSVDFVAVVVIIGQSGVNVGQGELREDGYDLVRRLPLFGPEYFIMHSDAVSGDARSSPARPGGDFDVGLLKRRLHENIVAGTTA